jgi:acetolactate synthase-1/3 small subunit
MPHNIKNGSSRHSAYDLRDANAPVNETQTLAVPVDNERGVLGRVIGTI